MSAIPEYPHRHAISASEYVRMGEAGVFAPDVHLELIEGEIIEMAPIGSPHAAVVNVLAAFFNRAVGERAVVSIQNPLVTGERSVPQPDLALLKPRPDNYFGAHPSAVDAMLVVEVVDATLSFDLDVKVPIYARAGVPEVWIVDIQDRSLRVFRDARPGVYRTALSVERGERISPEALPDIAIDAAILFPMTR